MRCVRVEGAPQMRALTLVELLVVVAVIALLAAVLLPSLAGARERSKSAVCLSNLRNFGQAVGAYHNENKDWFPLSSHTTGSLTRPDAWLQSLVPLGVLPASRACRNDPAAARRLSSYCSSDYMEPLVAGIDYDPFTGRTLPGGRSRAYTRISELPRPAATGYVVEAPGEGTIDHLHSVGWSTPAELRAGVAVTRHGAGANYLFADGHAAAIPWTYFEKTFSDETSFLNPETAR